MTLTILNTNKGNHKVFKTEAEAAALAADLNDEDFTYRVKLDPTGTGKAILEVVENETGEVIDLL